MIAKAVTILLLLAASGVRSQDDSLAGSFLSGKFSFVDPIIILDGIIHGTI